MASATAANTSAIRASDAAVSTAVSVAAVASAPVRGRGAAAESSTMAAGHGRPAPITTHAVTTPPLSPSPRLAASAASTARSMRTGLVISPEV